MDENLDLGCYCEYMAGTFDTRFLQFGLGSFGALCKISNFTIWFKTLLLSQFSSNSSKPYTVYHNHTGCHFFWRLSKFFFRLWHLKYSLSRTICCFKFSRCYFSHNFHWTPSKLYDNIGQHGKSECLLEYELI